MSANANAVATSSAETDLLNAHSRDKERLSEQKKGKEKEAMGKIDKMHEDERELQCLWEIYSLQLKSLRDYQAKGINDPHSFRLNYDKAFKSLKDDFKLGYEIFLSSRDSVRDRATTEIQRLTDNIRADLLEEYKKKIEAIFQTEAGFSVSFGDKVDHLIVEVQKKLKNARETLIALCAKKESVTTTEYYDELEKILIESNQVEADFKKEKEALKQNIFSACGKNDLPAVLEWIRLHQGSKTIANLLQHERDQGRSILNFACQNSNFEIIAALVEAKAPINQPDDLQKYATHYLSDNPHLGKNWIETLELLLKKGANFQAIDKHGRTALHKFCERGHLEPVKWLVEKFPELLNLEDENERSKRDRQTPLHYGARHAAVVDYLLKRGALVRKSQKLGGSALFQAAFFQCRDVIKVFLERGYCLSFLEQEELLNTKQGTQKLALYCDVLEEVYKSITELSSSIDENASFKKGAERQAMPADARIKPDKIAKIENASLFEAIKTGELKTVNDCIRKQDKGKLKAFLSAYDAEGQAPLHRACYAGNLEIVNALLNFGADPNQPSKNRVSYPVHFVVDNSQTTSEMMRELLKALKIKNALFNKLDYHNRSALFIAVRRKKDKAAEWLMGEDNSVLDLAADEMYGKHTPLLEAVWSEQLLMVRGLIREGANPSCLNSDGQTTLYMSIIRGSKNSADIFQWFLWEGFFLTVNERLSLLNEHKHKPKVIFDSLLEVLGGEIDRIRQKIFRKNAIQEKQNPAAVSGLGDRKGEAEGRMLPGGGVLFFSQFVDLSKPGGQAEKSSVKPNANTNAGVNANANANASAQPNATAVIKPPAAKR